LPLAGGRRSIDTRSVLRVLCHYDGKTGVEVEVDMAVKEPRPGIVRVKSDCNIVSGKTDIDGVPPNGVLEIQRTVSVSISTSQDRECVLWIPCQ